MQKFNVMYCNHEMTVLHEHEIKAKSIDQAVMAVGEGLSNAEAEVDGEVEDHGRYFPPLPLHVLCH